MRINFLNILYKKKTPQNSVQHALIENECKIQILILKIVYS